MRQLRTGEAESLGEFGRSLPDPPMRGLLQAVVGERRMGVKRSRGTRRDRLLLLLMLLQRLCRCFVLLLLLQDCGSRVRA